MNESLLKENVMPDQRGQILMISPAQAQIYYDHRARNRRIKNQLVEQYAKAIRAGQWRLDGNTLKFNADGQLIDGQHRLLACIKANIPFRTWAVFGISESDAQEIDTGVKRSLADKIMIAGFEVTPNTPSAVKWYFVLRDLPQGIVPTGLAATPPSTQSTIEILEQTEIRKSAKKLWEWGCMAPDRPRSLGALAALHCLFSSYDDSSPDKFFKSVASGVDVQQDSPVYVLRRRLVSAQRITVAEIIAITIKAFMAFRDGRSLRVLKWKHGGPEQFPYWRSE
jgi:hypothetical protein